MKKIFLSAISFFLVYINVNAQNGSQQAIDSTQRKIMKDSLQITDQIINQIFAVRNSMTVKIIALRRDTMLSANVVNVQIAAVRNTASTSIRQILGNQKYQQYTDMIRRWVSRRTNQNNEPLAEGDQ